MNVYHRLLPVAAALVSLLVPWSARAQPVAPSHFDAVAKHLQTGGVFYTLVDMDGDLEKFAAMGESLLNMAKHEAGGVIPPGLSAIGILKALGLERVKAIGMSSKATGGNLFHNRALVYMPDGRSGLFKLFGGEAKPLQAPAFAPAGSDLVMESELTLSALLEMAEALVTGMGNEQMIQQFKGLLGFPVPGLEMTAGDFISRLNTHLIVAGRLETGKPVPLPGSPISLPAFRLVISFDQIEFLFAPIIEYVKQTGNATVETGGDFAMIRPKEALPGELARFQPVFYHDFKSKRLLLGTHLDAVKECLAGKTSLSSDPSFAQATAGMPTEGNDFSYITPAIFQAINHLVEQTVKEMPATPGGPSAELMKDLMTQLEKLSPTPTLPMAGIRSNLPEGMLFLSNSTSSFKSALTVPAAAAAGLMAGLGFGFFETMAGAGRPPLPQPEEKAETEAAPADPEEAPQNANTKAIQANLKQIAFAAQSFFISHPDKTQVTYEQLIEDELLFRLQAVEEESYKDLKLKKTGGTLSIKSKSGTIRHAYTAAGE